MISGGLSISPPWEAEPGDLVIEPGEAFGTGEHSTTRACLQAIARWGQPGERCLDIGCGSGILALAAAHIGMIAEGVDIDPDAVAAAKRNAKKNRLTVSFHTTPIQQVTQGYDLVVSNLYAEALVQLSTDILRVSDGYLALAGILMDRVDIVLDAFSTVTLLEQHVDGDWVALWFHA